jgi:hypothetical protein
VGRTKKRARDSILIGRDILLFEREWPRPASGHHPHTHTSLFGRVCVTSTSARRAPMDRLTGCALLTLVFVPGPLPYFPFPPTSSRLIDHLVSSPLPSSIFGDCLSHCIVMMFAHRIELTSPLRLQRALAVVRGDLPTLE